MNTTRMNLNMADIDDSYHKRFSHLRWHINRNHCYSPYIFDKFSKKFKNEFELIVKYTHLNQFQGENIFNAMFRAFAQNRLKIRNMPSSSFFFDAASSDEKLARSKEVINQLFQYTQNLMNKQQTSQNRPINKTFSILPNSQVAQIINANYPNTGMLQRLCNIFSFAIIITIVIMKQMLITIWTST
jgi:hypothetical protein